MRKILIALAILVLVASAGVVANGARLKRFAYEGFGGRDDWQQPDVVVASLGVRPGDRVADIGAGGGYFTFRLADAVGNEGTVYAVERDEESLPLLRRNVDQWGSKNVQIIAGKAPDALEDLADPDAVFVGGSGGRLLEILDVATKRLRAGGRRAFRARHLPLAARRSLEQGRV